MFVHTLTRCAGRFDFQPGVDIDLSHQNATQSEVEALIQAGAVKPLVTSQSVGAGSDDDDQDDDAPKAKRTRK